MQCWRKKPQLFAKHGLPKLALRQSTTRDEATPSRAFSHFIPPSLAGLVCGRLVNRRRGYNRSTFARCVNESEMGATHSPGQAATEGAERSPNNAAGGAEEMTSGDMGQWSVHLRVLVGHAMRNSEGLGSTDVRPGERVSVSGAGVRRARGWGG